jgi:ATP synthase protein I
MKPEADVNTGPIPERRDLRLIGVATGLGCSIVAALVLCIGAGIWLDDRFGTKPVLTLIGVALGLAAAGRQLWQLTKLSGNREQTGPVSPRTTGRSSSREARNLQAQEPASPDREHGIEE